MRRQRRWRNVVAVVAISLTALSCSGPDSPLGSEIEDTSNSGSNAEGIDEVEAGSEAVDQGNGVNEEAESTRPSIWVRADDTAMRPTSPLASMREVMAPGGGSLWTIVGSIFDYDTGTTQPAVWSADAPGSPLSWTRIDIEQPDGGSAEMAGAVRAEAFDLAVGSHGRERDRRPAVWVRSVGDEWRPVDRSQFDRATPEWFDHVAVDRSNGLVMALGERTDAEGNSSPTLWVSAEGEEWDAVAGLPFAADGTENLRGLVSGSTTSVLTGERQAGSAQTAVAYWSSDGRTWTEAEVENTIGGGDSYLGEATWFNDRFVAVGGVATAGVFRPASWTSSDGQFWELETPPFEMAENGRVTNTGFGALRITSTDSTLYAASRSSFLQHLWQSSDGTNWTVIDDITEGRSQGLAVNSIAALDDQVLLTTGDPGVVIHKESFRQAPLSSELLPVPDEVPWVADVTHEGDGWVAVGGSSVQLPDRSTVETARLWRSSDGADWELGAELPEDSTGAVNAVAPWSDGLAAVGTESQRSATNRRRVGRGLIWQFSDSNWAEIDAPSVTDDAARIGLEAVTVAGDDLLAGGWRFAPTLDGSVDALLIQSTGGAPPDRVDIGYDGSDDELVVALCGNESAEAVALLAVQQPRTNGVAAVRRSPDREWSDAEWPSPPAGTEAYVSDCAYGVDGFLAAGSTVSGSDDDVGLWWSTDGSSWQRVDGRPSFSASANQWVTSMAATEAGYLLAGNDASSGVVQPVIWYGSGHDWEQTVITDAEAMTSLQVGFADGTIVVTGSKDGAVRAYSTTLDQLVTELNR